MKTWRSEMRKYSKYLVVAGSLAALAVPSAAMASQPTNPGGFGQERANNIGTVISGADWGQVAASRAGDNGTINQSWMVNNDQSLPVQSSLVTP
jgi:hypothetical protein